METLQTLAWTLLFVSSTGEILVEETFEGKKEEEHLVIPKLLQTLKLLLHRQILLLNS